MLVDEKVRFQLDLYSVCVVNTFLSTLQNSYSRNTSTLQCIKSHNMGNTASNHFIETVIPLTGPILGLLTSTSSLVVIKLYLQDLHDIMKNLLYALSGHSIIASTAQIAIKLYADDKNLKTCFLLFQAIFPSYCITCSMFSFMSAVRYYLASRTQELQAVKAWKFYLVAGMIYVIEHARIPTTYFLAIEFDIPCWATQCASKFSLLLSLNTK